MESFKLAFRNLRRQKKRSVFLILAVAFGFMVVTIIDGMSAGVLNNMQNKFAAIYAGNLIIQGAEKKTDGTIVQLIRDDTLITQIVRESNLNIEYQSKRSVFKGTALFETASSRIQVFGCDADSLKFLHDTVTLTQGEWNTAEKPHSIVIGQSTAKTLNVQLGDTILVETRTVGGQNTVGEFVLSGICRDTSFVDSYAAYADIGYVNAILGMSQNSFTQYTLMLAPNENATAAAALIEAALAKNAPVTSRSQAASERSANSILAGLNDQLNKTSWNGTKYSVITLNDVLPIIGIVLNIVRTVSLILLLVLFAIVMVGISNTFRMVIYERIREIGTMRALGMKRSGVGRLFILEALFTGIFGCLAGLACALIFMLVFSLVNFGDPPTIAVFMEKGHWTFILDPLSVVTKLLLCIVLTVFAVWGNARRASKTSPAEAMRTVK